MPFPWESVRTSRQVLIGALIGVLALVGAIGVDTWQVYRLQIAKAQEESRRSAALLAEHTDRVFDVIEGALRELDRLLLEDETTVEDPARAHSVLRTIHGGTPVLKTVGWVNGDGKLVATSYSPIPPPADFTEIAGFRALRDGGAETQATYISAPFYAKLLGATYVLVARRMTAADGTFLGIYYGLLDPLYFSEVFEAAGIDGASVVTLSKSDGTVLASRPLPRVAEDPTSVDLPFSIETVRETLGTAMSGSMRTGLEPLSEDQIVGAALTEDRRLMLSISTSVDVVLAAFYEQLYAELWPFLFAIGILGAVAATLVVQIRRREALSERLQENERKFRDFATASGDWFWETDAEHRMIWMSAAVETSVGFAVDWHTGKRRRDLCTPHLLSDPGIFDEHEALLDRHEPFSDFEYPRQTSDGVLWIRTSGVPVFGPDGTFIGYRGSARDISDFVDAKARLKDATDAIPGGFLLFDDADRLVYRNAPTRQPTGVAWFEAIGETFESIVRRSGHSGLVEEAKEDPEAWIQWRLEQHRAADRPSLIHVNGRAIELIERPTSDGGRVLLRFDVTDREIAYQELRQARDMANAASQAKSDFLSSMSHELRTPLNAIIGFGELLTRANGREISADQVAEYSGYIVSSGRHLLNLVSEVLDLSNVEAGHLKIDLESVGVRAIVERAVENVRPLAVQRDIDLKVEIPDSVGKVLADSQRALQVLINLLSNAIKYNNQHGSVLIEAQAENGQVTVRVTDDGPGIDPKKAERLFSPFDRLGAEFGSIEGTGIGLALSKRLMSEMSGRIGHRPAQPTGSTFWITLPIDEESTVSADENRISARLPEELPEELLEEPLEELLKELPGRTVLCIEDDTLDMRIVEHLVDGIPGIGLLEAATGTEGLYRARTQQPDVIFLDLNLPDMSGYDVLAGLRADPATSAIPVVVMTASAAVEDLQRAKTEGVFRYLTKPLDLDALLRALKEAVGATVKPAVGRLPVQVFEPRVAAETIAEPAATAAGPHRTEDETRDVSDPDPLDTASPGAHLLDPELLDSIRSMIQSDLFNALVDQLVEDIERQADAYGRIIADADLSTVGNVMHSLKGQCLNMGAVALGDLTARLSDAARRGDREALEQAHADFAALSAATAESLRDVSPVADTHAPETPDLETRAPGPRMGTAP